MRMKIGQIHQFALDNLDAMGVTPMRQILSPEIFRSAQDRIQRASTILIPEVVFWLMTVVALKKQSMAGAITDFWAKCGAQWFLPAASPVTEEAFCTARANLKLRFFKRLFSSVNQRYHCQENLSLRWKGFRLLAIDGMKITLPASKLLKRFFPPAANQKGPSKTSQGLLVGLVGLIDGFCYDFKLTSSKGSEQKCARRMISRSVHKGDLLLCDKNFPDYETLALMTSQKADYLFRLQWKRFDHYHHEAIRSGHPDEWYITLKLPKRISLQRPELPMEVKARVIRYAYPGFRPSLLITSLLDTETYDYETIVSLYHERWRQETMHREWKYSLTMDNFRSKSVRGIFKEVYVQLTVNNVLRWIMAESLEGTSLRPVDLKYLESKRLLLSYYDVMSFSPAAQLPILYEFLKKEILMQEIVVRPGRSYPRKNDNKTLCKGNGQFVLPARIQPEELATI